jgi:uncharacterized protein
MDSRHHALAERSRDKWGLIYPVCLFPAGGRLFAVCVGSIMRPSEILPQHRETIRQLVLQAGMANPRVFGSVLHGEDREDSDLDLLVDPAPRASLLDMAGLQIELEKALGVKVDVRTPGELHPRFREEVLAEAASL